MKAFFRPHFSGDVTTRPARRRDISFHHWFGSTCTTEVTNTIEAIAKRIDCRHFSIKSTYFLHLTAKYPNWFHHHHIPLWAKVWIKLQSRESFQNTVSFLFVLFSIFTSLCIIITDVKSVVQQCLFLNDLSFHALSLHRIWWPMTKEPVPLGWTLVTPITKNVITIKDLFRKKHGSPFHTRYYIVSWVPRSDQASSPKSWVLFFFK